MSRKKSTTRSLPATSSTRLFNETIVEKLAISQIMSLLREKPLSTGEIAQVVGLDPVGSIKAPEHVIATTAGTVRRTKQKLLRQHRAVRREIRTTMDNERIDEIIDKHNGEASSLIQVLLDIQSENHWLPKEALERVAESLAGAVDQDTAYRHLL